MKKQLVEDAWRKMNKKKLYIEIEVSSASSRSSLFFLLIALSIVQRIEKFLWKGVHRKICVGLL